MKAILEKRLFWYLKEGTELNLKNPSHIDMYVQQVLSHGRAEDIKRMIKTVLPKEVLRESFQRIKGFLPKEVRTFWEKGLGDPYEPPKGNN
jgi:hypothetical protein